MRRSVEQLELRLLIRDEFLRTRLHTDSEVAAEYAAQMQRGAVFPPVLVFSDGQSYWLADGYHRTAARELCGESSVLAEIREGTSSDAVWAACAANKTHGLRRSNADKRLSVERALALPRAARLSDRQIGQHCGVHHYTVSRIRREFEAKGFIASVTDRETVRGGSRYLQRTAGISDANAARSVKAGEDEAANVACSEAPASRSKDASVREEHSSCASQAFANAETFTLDSVRRLQQLLKRAEACLVAASDEIRGISGTEEAVTLTRYTSRLLRELQRVRETMLKIVGQEDTEIE